jgi:hypothetical protein
MFAESVRMCAGPGMRDRCPNHACTSAGSAVVNLPSRLTGIPCFAQVCADAGLVHRNLAMAAQPFKTVGAGALFFLGI